MAILVLKDQTLIYKVEPLVCTTVYISEQLLTFTSSLVFKEFLVHYVILYIYIVLRVAYFN